nr:hypothetical protein CFP56_11762 [Quercus suber]
MGSAIYVAVSQASVTALRCKCSQVVLESRTLASTREPDAIAGGSVAAKRLSAHVSGVLTCRSRLSRLDLPLSATQFRRYPQGFTVERFLARAHLITTTCASRNMISKQHQELPSINGDDSFDDMMRKLCLLVCWREPAHFCRNTFVEGSLLTDTNACRALKSHFVAVEDDDDRGVNETRGLACELVAWRFITHLTQHEAVDHLCRALWVPRADGTTQSRSGVATSNNAAEQTPLLADNTDESASDSLAQVYCGLSALEIAVVADAKEFMSQKAIQRILSGIFWGDIVFWETLSTHVTNTKKARVYNKERSDPFSRLRVPVYLKTFEALFFLAFLAIYYTVLVQKPFATVYTSEILLYVWIASFAYNGSTLYAKDFWALWDIGIIVIGAAFFCLRMIGLAKEDQKITDVAFDILSVEALFLVPRNDDVVARLTPTGFDTTFVFLARGQYSAGGMNWILVKVRHPFARISHQLTEDQTLLTNLIKVFFGSSYLGFVSWASTRRRTLLTALDLTSAWSTIDVLFCNFNKFIAANCTTLTVVESTHTVPAHPCRAMVQATVNLIAPLHVVIGADSSSQNLLSLLMRPLRLVVSGESLRHARIMLLKAVHLPHVGMILAFESGRLYWNDRRSARSSSRTPLQGLNMSRVSRFSRLPHSGRSTRDGWSMTGVTAPPLLEDLTRADQSLVSSSLAHPSFASFDELEEVVASLQTQLETMTSVIARAKVGMAAAAAEGHA